MPVVELCGSFVSLTKTFRSIDRVHAEGGKLTYFTSFAGGLPAPECDDNPFGYKFSWAPRGVLLAGKNPASFYRDGGEQHITGEVSWISRARIASMLTLHFRSCFAPFGNSKCRLSRSSKCAFLCVARRHLTVFTS